MNINKEVMTTIIAMVFAAFFAVNVEPAAADFFDKLKKKAEEAVNEMAEDKTNETKGMTPKKTGNSTVSKPSSASPSKSASASGAGGFVSLDDLAADRMPLNGAALNTLRFKFEPDYTLEEKALINTTKMHISCHRVTDGDLKKFDDRPYIRMVTEGQGCLGQRRLDASGSVLAGKSDWRWVRIFETDEVAGRNPDFSARELRGKMLAALKDAGAHMPTRFANTGGWRGEYDFDTGQLVINARPFEPLSPSWKRRLLPEDEQNRDAYGPPQRLSAAEYAPLKIIWPRVDAGVQAIAFDRNLGEGRFNLSGKDAEALISNENVYERSGGTAVVEFTVEKTKKGAAFARLDQVIIMAKKGKAWIDLEPYLTIPASAFPKVAQSSAAASPQSISKPKQAPAAKAPAKNAPEAKADPLTRADLGKAFGPDVVGLRLGMTIDEADKIIRKRKKPIKVVDGQPPTPFASARIYALQPGDESIALFALKTPREDQIAGIQRMVYFSPEKSPSQTALAATVEKKYGQPSYTYEVKTQFKRAWRVDWKGNRLTGNDCGQNYVGGGGSDPWRQDEEYFTWPLPWGNGARGSANSLEIGNKRNLEQVSRCGTVLNVGYSGNSGMRMGPTLSFDLYDPAWIVAADAARRAAETKKGAEDLDL